MPIGKVICSSSFAATARYVLIKEQATLLNSGTMLGKNADDLVWEFEQSKRLNPDINRPCLHLILSYSQEDERLKTLDNDLLAEISEEHFAGCAVLSRWHKPLEKLDKNEYRRQVEEFKESELNHYQFFSAIHEDVHHRHTHLVGSRINTLDGKCLETWQNQIKSQYVIREIEERYGLEINQSSWEKDYRGLSRRQLEKWQETGIKPLQLELRETLDEKLARVDTVDELVDELQKDGVDVRFSRRESGEIYGVSYARDGVSFRGSKLGNKYSLKGLERILIQNKEPEINGTRGIEKPNQRDINRDIRANRAAVIRQHRCSNQAINGIGIYKRRGQTRRVATTVRRLESTLNRIDDCVRNQQQITAELARRVREVEHFQCQQEQVKQQESRKQQHHQQAKKRDKGIEH